MLRISLLLLSVVSVVSVVSMSPGIASAFDEELPKRSTPDVPLFVGPATMEISGNDGAYRWEDVRFGAEEVSVEVDTGSEACLARLRLVEDDEALVDEWFEPAGPVEVTLGVDYASARLKVDTDCPAWTMRFVPIEDPDLPYEIRNVRYPVKGKTIDALVAQVQHIDGKWAAFTKWYTSWEYSIEETDSACLATNGGTQLSATIEYPSWRMPAGADPAVVGEWQRYIDSLTTHELGHVTIALQGADAIDDRLDAGFSAESCAQVSDDAVAASNEILEQYNQASARYDKDTQHGSSQGVELE